MVTRLYRLWGKFSTKKFPPKNILPHILPPFTPSVPHILPPFMKCHSSPLNLLASYVGKLRLYLPISFHLSRFALTFACSLSRQRENFRLPISFHLSQDSLFSKELRDPISFHLSPHILPPFTPYPSTFSPYPSTFHPISFHLLVRFFLFCRHLQPHKTLKTS